MGTVSTRMKIFLVYCLLSISFLSHGWCKHYLVRTADANEDDKFAYANEDDNDDYSDVIRKDKKHDKFGLDTKTVDAETLMYTVLTDPVLDVFEKYPENTREQIFKEVNKLIDYARNGEGDDYQGLGIIENIKKMLLGGEQVLGGGSQMLGGGSLIMNAINSFVGFIPNFI